MLEAAVEPVPVAPVVVVVPVVDDVDELLIVIVPEQSGDTV
jgi:hypothetical protein